MSHTALRRVMIRLLHDPGFATALYDDPERALADVALDASERAWLVSAPRAAWRADSARPARVLAALVEEYPATCVLAAERAAGFFASPAFHAAVQERGSLALALGDHLLGDMDPRVRALAALERAIADIRRVVDGPRAEVAGTLRLAPRARVLRVPEGALALLGSLRAGDAPPDDGAPRELGPGDESVLAFARHARADVTLEALPSALTALLRRAEIGATHAELATEARSQGALPGEDVEIVAGLVADGLVVER